MPTKSPKIARKQLTRAHMPKTPELFCQVTSRWGSMCPCPCKLVLVCVTWRWQKDPIDVYTMMLYTLTLAHIIIIVYRKSSQVCLSVCLRVCPLLRHSAWPTFGVTYLLDVDSIQLMHGSACDVQTVRHCMLDASTASNSTASGEFFESDSTHEKPPTMKHTSHKRLSNKSDFPKCFVFHRNQ